MLYAIPMNTDSTTPTTTRTLAEILDDLTEAHELFDGFARDGALKVLPVAQAGIDRLEAEMVAHPTWKTMEADQAAYLDRLEAEVVGRKLDEGYTYP